MAEENINLYEVEFHKHTGSDAPKINENDIENAIDKNTVVLKTTDQTIDGVKTFTDIPVLPASDPISNNQAVRKSYVDDLIDFTYTINVSDFVVDSADTERSSTSTSDDKKKEIKYNETDSTIKVTFEMKSITGANVSALVYKNGVSQTTISSTSTTYEDKEYEMEVDTDDLVQLYLNAEGAGRTVYVKNFRLRYARYITPISGTVNTN